MTNEQKLEAIKMFNDGKTLGEIAEHFGVSVYSLSPWIYAAHLRAK